MFWVYFSKTCSDLRKHQLCLKLGIAVIVCIILCSTCYLAEYRGKSPASSAMSDRKTEKLIQINHRSDNQIQKFDNGDSPFSFLRCGRTDASEEGSGHYMGGFGELKVSTVPADAASLERNRAKNYISDIIDSSFREKHKRFEASAVYGNEISMNPKLRGPLKSYTNAPSSVATSYPLKERLHDYLLQLDKTLSSRGVHKTTTTDQDASIDADIFSDPLLSSSQSEERYFPHEFLFNSDISVPSEEDLDFLVTDEDRGDFIQLPADPYNTQWGVNVPKVMNSLFSSMPNSGVWSFPNQNPIGGDALKSDASDIQPRWKPTETFLPQQKPYAKQQGRLREKQSEPALQLSGLDLKNWFLKSEKDISTNFKNSVRIFSEMFGSKS